MNAVAVNRECWSKSMQQPPQPAYQEKNASVQLQSWLDQDTKASPYHGIANVPSLPAAKSGNPPKTDSGTPKTDSGTPKNDSDKATNGSAKQA